MFRMKAPFPPPSPSKERFTFIDLYSGIGGFRLVMQKYCMNAANHLGKCMMDLRKLLDLNDFLKSVLFHFHH